MGGQPGAARRKALECAAGRGGWAARYTEWACAAWGGAHRDEPQQCPPLASCRGGGRRVMVWTEARGAMCASGRRSRCMFATSVLTPQRGAGD